ncbi:MAG: DNA polymerase III subunit gamma/tau [Actinobacteria bacterium]|nr:DNA polymerase III subunit gamma/tau [Actinomycetota bacterium]MCG2808468.1 DNA polymerase III subunit gamma/tau [Coriobacteriia bacterium]
MAHQSLYRKYRPSDFDDVVGQSHITRTLRNAIAEDTVAHAYLFTGPRGTGKTTTARILAKALLCEKGPTPDPDTTCEQCLDVAHGRHPDVLEVDAASRTGVDNVREEIIGRLAYAATRGGYKIYIIDEVHMLSTGAFNALLKSIEEPPAKVVFVLCTTHPHKVPETIHSRCQRFDFHRIGVDDLVKRLEYICEKEGITVAQGALTLVAKHAAGGMRDAITTLEQLSAFTGRSIALDDVEGLLGQVDTALLVEISDLIAARDVVGCFRFVARLGESGVDMAEFVRELTGHTRDLYVTSVVGDPAGIVDTTGEQLARIVTQAGSFTPARLARILDTLGDLGAELRWSSDPRLSLEVAFTRMARPEGDLTLDALAERVEMLEIRGSQAGPAVAPAVSKSSVAEAAAQASAPVAPVKQAESHPAAQPAAVAPAHAAPVSGSEAPASEPPTPEPAAAEVPHSSGPLDRAHIKRAWPAVLAEFRRIKPSRAGGFASTEVDIDPDGVTMVVEFPADQSIAIVSAPETREVLGTALAKVLGSVPPYRFQQGRGAVQPIVTPEPSVHVDAPIPVVDETLSHNTPQAVVSVPAPESAEEHSIEHLLMTELGAEMVAEHPHDAGDGKDPVK